MKLQNLSRLVLIFLVLSTLNSCLFKEDNSDTRIITVSVLPFKYFAEGIAGDDFLVNVIVPPGASPATFEPPPSVIKNLQQSELAIYNGYLGFEQAWMEKLMQVNPDIKTLYLANNQNLIAAEQHKHGDHFHYSGVDPHFWMSPVSARVIAADVRDFLVGNYPEETKKFEENYKSLIGEIDEVAAYIDSVFAGLESRSFLIFHPALTYFARDYDLVQIPIEFEGKEPTAGWLNAVIRMAKKDSIRTIMVQQEFNRKSAETIAKEIGADVVDIFPLSDDWVKSIMDVTNSIAEMEKKNLELDE